MINNGGGRGIDQHERVWGQLDGVTYRVNRNHFFDQHGFPSGIHSGDKHGGVHIEIIVSLEVKLYLLIPGSNIQFNVYIFRIWVIPYRGLYNG